MNAARTNQCVQCDACFKWRILPNSCSDLPDKWYCFMHPSKSFNCCNVPQENFDESTDTGTSVVVSTEEDHRYLADTKYSNNGQNIAESINSVIYKNLPKIEPPSIEEEDDIDSKQSENSSQMKMKKTQHEPKKRRTSSSSTLPSEPYPVVTRKKAKQEFSQTKSSSKQENFRVASKQDDFATGSNQDDSRDGYVQEIYQKVVDKFVSAIQSHSPPTVKSSSAKPVRRVSCGVQVDFSSADSEKFNPDMVRKLLDNHVKLIQHHEKFQSNVARLLETFFPGLEIEQGENLNKTVENLLGASLMMKFQQKSP